VGKPGNPAGRMLVDPTNASAGNHPLNCPQVKEIGELKWGHVRCPTIGEIIATLTNHATANGSLVSEYRLCKEDISNAFGCNKIAPQDAALFATRLSATLVMIHFYNNFGHTIAPHIFGPLGRSLTESVNAKVDGVVATYVDDLNGFFHYTTALRDQNTMVSTMKGLLGPKALSDKSWGPSPTGEVIGWYIDLTAGTIRPNDRGIRKLALVFLTLDISPSARWSLHLCQVLASLTERYSRGIIGMRTFVEPFIALTRSAAAPGANSISASRKINSLVRMSAILWRAIIVILLSQPERLAVPLQYMSAKKDKSFDYSAITDASDSVGLILFGKTTKAIACTSYLLPFEAHDGRYQNTRELLGVMLSLVLFKSKFNLPAGTKIGVKSDSISAIMWITKNRAASQYAHVAFLTYTWICIVTRYEIVDITHIAGKSDEMFDIDALSRNLRTRDVNYSTFVETTPLPWLNDIFSLCDPTKDRTKLNDHYEVFNKVVRNVAKSLRV